MFDGAITSLSMKQGMITRSLTEVEVVASDEIVSPMIWTPIKNNHGSLMHLKAPTARADNCKVATIIEEYKLFFNPHIVALVFTQEPQLHTTCDVHWSV